MKAVRGVIRPEGDRQRGGKKTLWAITLADERTFSLGVLQSWRRVLPQLCCSCLNSIHNVKRKTRLGWPLTPQTLVPINNSSFLAHTVVLFTLRINKVHGFPGDICSQQAMVGPQSEPNAGIRFLICIYREMCFVAPATGSGAVHFKPVAHVTSRETGSPAWSARDWSGWWFSAGSL